MQDKPHIGLVQVVAVLVQRQQLFNCKMKKSKFILLLLICTTLAFCKAKKHPIYSTKKTKIATRINSDYLFVIDTIQYKDTIAKKIFSENSQVFYNKIEICKGITLERLKQEYYFLKLTDSKKNVVTVRHLIKKENDLFFSNDTNFDSYYVSCAGTLNLCPPNLYIDEHLEKNWICSDQVGVCSTDSLNCRIFKTILIE